MGKSTNGIDKGDREEQREGRHVQEKTSHQQILPKKKTPHYSQQGRPKRAKGRETHALHKQQTNRNNSAAMKIKNEEMSHQGLYQCTHWHPIYAEKSGACAGICSV